MIRAWYMDDDTSNQRNDEHHKNPLTPEKLFEASGVEYFKLNIDTVDTDEVLAKIKKDKGYTYEKEILCFKDSSPSYNEKFRIAYREHKHSDEEIRLVTDGSGYFDVRDRSGKWIRIEVIPGDLLILPSGIYHKFTYNNKDFIKIRRISTNYRDCLAHNRDSDQMDGCVENAKNLVKCQ